MSGPVAEGVEFWARYGHGPGDGCDPEDSGGARADVWRAVHEASSLVDVDYMPPVNPARPRLSPGRQVMIPADLWDAVRADALAQRDLARGESELFRARTTSATTAGDRAVQQWATRNPGLAQLLDHPAGGAR